MSRRIGTSLLIHGIGLAVVVAFVAVAVAITSSGVDALLLVLMTPALVVLAGPGLLLSVGLLVAFRRGRLVTRVAVCAGTATAVTAVVSALYLGSIDLGPNATPWDIGPLVICTAILAGGAGLVAATRGIRTA